MLDDSLETPQNQINNLRHTLPLLTRSCDAVLCPHTHISSGRFESTFLRSVITELALTVSIQKTEFPFFYLSKPFQNSALSYQKQNCHGPHEPQSDSTSFTCEGHSALCV